PGLAAAGSRAAAVARGGKPRHGGRATRQRRRVCGPARLPRDRCAAPDRVEGVRAPRCVARARDRTCARRRSRARLRAIVRPRPRGAHRASGRLGPRRRNRTAQLSPAPAGRNHRPRARHAASRCLPARPRVVAGRMKTPMSANDAGAGVGTDVGTGFSRDALSLRDTKSGASRLKPVPTTPNVGAGPDDVLDDFPFGLLGISVAIALLAHVAHLPPWLGLSGFCLLALRVVGRRRRHGAVSNWLRLPLAGALFALVIANYGTPFGREPGTELAIGILVLKLLETERIRDARVTIAFSAFVLMSALLADQGLVFTALVCLALVVLLGALVSLQPAPANARGRGTLHDRIAPFRLGAQLLGVGVPLALAAFLFVPRLSEPWWGAPGADSARTGLRSEERRVGKEGRWRCSRKIKI